MQPFGYKYFKFTLSRLLSTKSENIYMHIIRKMNGVFNLISTARNEFLIKIVD